MNIRKPVNYSAMFKASDDLIAVSLPQMELYSEIGWTQNVVILKSELTLQERAWYIQTVQKYNWSKLELQRKISSKVHLENTLDLAVNVCYTEENSTAMVHG